MSRESSETDSEMADPSGDWGKLPYVALALIFSYLPDRDKFNASLVNRTWREGFSWPGNWRQREMIFYGVCDDVVEKEKAFCKRFGAQLRFLRLRCWSPAQGPALESYLENVAGAMHVLSQNASLREIHVADVEGLGYTDDELITVNDFLFESERRAEGKAKMAVIIGQLIRTQDSLRVLDLQEVDCAWEVGLELLSAIAESSAATTTLHTLLLSGAFNHLPSGPAASSAAYILAMSSFRSLAYLRMDYRCLSSKLLEVLGISLGNCFRRLAILCSEEDGPDLPNLEDDAWRTLSSRCPFLRVELTIGKSFRTLESEAKRRIARNVYSGEYLMGSKCPRGLQVCSKMQWSHHPRTVAQSYRSITQQLSVVPEGGNRNAGWRNTLLKPGMPLASLSLDGEMSIEHLEYWDTTPTLELLLREYRNTLEHLSLALSQRADGLTAETLTTEMVSRALRLKRLKTLHLSGPIDSGAITSLYGLLDESHHAKHLQVVTLTVWCTSEDEIDQLLKANRLLSQNRDSAKTEVRLVPML